MSSGTLSVTHTGGDSLEPELKPDGNGGTIELIVRIYGQYPTANASKNYTDITWLDAHEPSEQNTPVESNDSITIHNVKPNRTVEVFWRGYIGCENPNQFNITLRRDEI